MKHTGGEWTTEFDEIAEAWTVWADDGGDVTHIALVTAKHDDRIRATEAADNAVLVREAPKMLDLLRRIAAPQDDPTAIEQEIEALFDRLGTCIEHDWQEQPGEPPVDVCSSCGETRE